jgi:hypothetical protein
VPAGDPDGGQWTDGGGGGAIADSRGPGDAGISGTIVVAGGFTEPQRDMSIQSFVSAYCKASIYSVLPGQFLGKTIQEVMDLAQSGDAAAKTCLKLLGRDRFLK